VKGQNDGIACLLVLVYICSKSQWVQILCTHILHSTISRLRSQISRSPNSESLGTKCAAAVKWRPYLAGKLGQRCFQDVFPWNATIWEMSRIVKGSNVNATYWNFCLWENALNLLKAVAPFVEVVGLWLLLTKAWQSVTLKYTDNVVRRWQQLL